MWISCMLIQQQDQKIVLAGNSATSIYDPYDYALLRLNVDGSIDSSFGVNGYVLDSVHLFPGHIYWVQTYSIAQQQNGKLVMAGTAGGWTGSQDPYPHVTWLTRYDENGNIDSSFGTNGVVMLYFDSIWPQSKPSVFTGTGGRIFLTALYTSNFPTSSPLSANRVICFDSTGRIDSTYGTYGAAYVSTDQLGYIYSSTLQADQKILLGGADTTQTAFSLIRYTASGFIDSAFGNNGVARISCDSDFGGFNYLYVQKDSSILATKYESALPASDGTTFKLSRFTSTGDIDNTFGQSGCAQAIVPSGVNVLSAGVSGASFVAEYSDGKILIAGTAINDTLLSSSGPVRTRVVFAFIRFLPNGIIDSTFGSAGVVISPPVPNPGPGFTTMSGFSLLSNGEFITADDIKQADKFLAYAPTPNGIKGMDVNSISIYPDPAGDHLYISGLPPSATLCIIDMTGRICYTPSSLREIDVSALPSGVYLLRIQDSSAYVVKKFVKE